MKNADYAVKFIDVEKGTFVGLLCPNGGIAALKGKDFDGEYFTKDTDYRDDLFQDVQLPILYQHGRDSKVKAAIIGRVTKKWDDEMGRWIEGQLNLADSYAQAVAGIIKRGGARLSSGAISHLKTVELDGRISCWPVCEASVTPTPANPTAVIPSYKAVKILEDAGASLATLKGIYSKGAKLSMKSKTIKEVKPTDGKADEPESAAEAKLEGKEDSNGKVSEEKPQTPPAAKAPPEPAAAAASPVEPAAPAPAAVEETITAEQLPVTVQAALRALHDSIVDIFPAVETPEQETLAENEEAAPEANEPPPVAQSAPKPPAVPNAAPAAPKAPEVAQEPATPAAPEPPKPEEKKPFPAAKSMDAGLNTVDAVKSLLDRQADTFALALKESVKAAVEPLMARIGQLEGQPATKGPVLRSVQPAPNTTVVTNPRIESTEGGAEKAVMSSLIDKATDPAVKKWLSEQGAVSEINEILSGPPRPVRGYIPRDG